MNFNIRNIKPSGNTLNGIFHEILKKISDPVTKGFFSIVGPTLCGSLSYLVNGAGDWASSQGSSYFEISFGERVLFPTHYSIRGALNHSWCYQTAWEVYGYNISDRDNETKWTKLGKNYDKPTSACSNESLCAGKGTSTFSLSNPNRKGFQYIRFIATESTCYSHIVSSGVDFYGSLISNINYGNERTCKRKIQQDTIPVHYLALLLYSR